MYHVCINDCIINSAHNAYIACYYPLSTKTIAWKGMLKIAYLAYFSREYQFMITDDERFRNRRFPSYSRKLIPWWEGPLQPLTIPETVRYCNSAERKPEFFFLISYARILIQELQIPCSRGLLLLPALIKENSKHMIVGVWSSVDWVGEIEGEERFVERLLSTKL